MMRESSAYQNKASRLFDVINTDGSVSRGSGDNLGISGARFDVVDGVAGTKELLKLKKFPEFWIF